MSDDVEVRRLRPDDWRLIRDLRLSALRGDGRWFGGDYATAAARTEAQWRAWPADGTVFAALVAAEPVGLVAGVRSRHDERAELIAMWIGPDGRGRGLAARLIDAVADWARDDGRTELWLNVLPANTAARRAYDRYGFTLADTAVDEHGHLAMHYRL